MASIDKYFEEIAASAKVTTSIETESHVAITSNFAISLNKANATLKYSSDKLDTKTALHCGNNVLEEKTQQHNNNADNTQTATVNHDGLENLKNHTISEIKQNDDASKNLIKSESPLLLSEDASLAEQETLIILDWDDTLLCSSWLASNGYRLDSPPIRGDNSTIDQALKNLEDSVIAMLETTLTHGKVFIITNAENGWVQLSAQKFLPATVRLLERAQILSARSSYERYFPKSPLKWKFHAFQQKLYPFYNEPQYQRVLKNVLSFGDSHVERAAVRACTRGLGQTLTKSIKFAERPSLDQLRRQIDLVTNCFHYIRNHTYDLDLQLTVQSLGPDADGSVSAKPNAFHYDDGNDISNDHPAVAVTA